MVSGNEGPTGTISHVHRLVIMSVQITVQCTMYIHHGSARIYRLSFRENEPKNGRFHTLKPAFWACFCEHWVYKFGHRIATIKKIARMNTLRR